MDYENGKCWGITPLLTKDQGSSTFCRLVSLQGGGKEMRGLRSRNRLYKLSGRKLVMVPMGAGSSSMKRMMRNGRLFVLTSDRHWREF